MATASNQSMNSNGIAQGVANSPSSVATLVSEQQLSVLSNDPMMLSKTNSINNNQCPDNDSKENGPKLAHAKSTGCLPPKESKVQATLKRSSIMKSMPELRRLISEEEGRMLLAARIQARSKECAKGASQMRQSLEALRQHSSPGN